MKEIYVVLCSVCGILGSIIAGAFGGWDAGMVTLVTFMCIDYISGIIVAGVFKRSNKSETGALSSKVGWIGLCKKFMTLLIVVAGYRLDLLIQTDYIRDAVVIGFCVNELISIIENAGLMGLPLPHVLIEAIEVLKGKGEHHE